MMRKSPSLIIGMHRSGTTLLSECLEDLGWYGGWLKNSSNESTFYTRINNWIMQNCGVDWETVNNIEHLIDANYDLLKVAVQRAEKYIGWLEYNQRIAFRQKTEWGFKDPRNCFTLPFWNKYYQDIKIVHIKRHGLDVARSLLNRKKDHCLKRQQATVLSDVWDIYKGEKLYTTTVTSSTNDALALWYKYEQRCQSQLQKQNAISVSFEDLLDKPFDTLRSIAGFLELKVTDSDCAKAALRIDKTRSLAYKQDLESNVGNIDDISKARLYEMGYRL